MSSVYHEPVLREEALRFLLTPGGHVFVDGTLGGGGHAEEICRRMNASARLVCFDADGDAIRVAAKRLGVFGDRVEFVHSNFRNLGSELRSRNMPRIDGLLLDLGVSSFQIDEGAKGFSFRSDERIDMRLDRRQRLSGWDIVNTYPEEALAGVLWKYGEERAARRIACAIVASRPVDTTGSLSDVVQSVVGDRFLTKTLSRVFQAIRIQVNDELASLETALTESVALLSNGARLVVISYHSLEDRIVKEFLRHHSATTIPSGHKLVPDTAVTPTFRLLTKRPVTPSAAEVARNNRARSAKLRAAERINA